MECGGMPEYTLPERPVSSQGGMGETDSVAMEAARFRDPSSLLDICLSRKDVLDM